MAIHVLIIGAGIGGLVLAHGLKKHDIPFHVYEKDAPQEFRAKGYRIRIAREGVEALRYLLDDETWGLFELTCGVTELRPIPEIDAESAEIRVADAGGVGTSERRDGATSRPYTVDRALFREILLRGLRGRISFGKLLRRYDLKDDGASAVFDDGSTWHGSLLVGADGAHSAVRTQYLPNHRILDTRARCLYGKTELRMRALVDLLPRVSEGGIQVIKDRTQEPFPTMVLEPVVFPNREQMRQEEIEPPTDYLHWVLTIQDEVLEEIDQGDCRLTSEECENLALRLSERWHPRLRAILEHQAPGETGLLPMRSVPAAFGNWESDERVTLLGDAIHLMGPTVEETSGSGAITTIRDAQHLCQALVEDGLTKESIAKYENQMRTYAGEVVRRSWENAKAIFTQSSSNDENIGELMAQAAS